MLHHTPYTRQASGAFDDSEFDAGPHLRSAFSIPPGVPINLSVLPDPPPGKRPAFPLEALVQLAIYGSPGRKLTLQEIYSAIEGRFEYFRTTSSSWKASIRHMLSLKSVFVQSERPRYAPGRGHYWQLDFSVDVKYKRPRKRKSRRLTSQSRSSTPDSFVDSDGKSRVEEMYSSSAFTNDATFRDLEKVKSTPSATPPLASDCSTLPPYSHDIHCPAPQAAYPYDFGLGGDSEGVFESQPTVDPSSDLWWGTPIHSTSPILPDWYRFAFLEPLE